MTARIRLEPSGHHFTAEPHETLLEAALRAGLSPTYSCNNGSCGECRARLVSGQLGERQHHDYVFSAAEKACGYFLMCSACAGSDLVLEAHEAGSVADIPLQRLTTRIQKLERVSDDVMVLHLRTPRSQTLRFLAGQHVRLTLPGVEARHKSIASCPCNAMQLQFHIRRVPGDAFAEAVFSDLKPMQPIEVEGPFGSFTLDENVLRPLIFLAYDTGFSPIKSLIEHAIALEYPKPMHLYWVVRAPGEHYLGNYCRSWADALDDFRFTPLAGDGGQHPDEAFLLGARHIADDYGHLAGHDVYINGPESVMAETRQLLLDKGLQPERLFIDYLQRI